MQTLAIILILAGPLACFLGCLVACVAELITASNKPVRRINWNRNR